MTRVHARPGHRPLLARRHRPRALRRSASRRSTPSCVAADLDPPKDWLPIAPAAHYLCGGVVTDLDGASDLAGPVGRGRGGLLGRARRQPAGVNSLLEGMVFAFRAVEAIERGKGEAEPTGRHARACSTATSSRGVIGGRPVPHGQVSVAGSALTRRDSRRASGIRESLQRTMTRDAGVLRTADSLRRARTRDRWRERRSASIAPIRRSGLRPSPQPRSRWPTR